MGHTHRRLLALIVAVLSVLAGATGAGAQPPDNGGDPPTPPPPAPQPSSPQAGDAATVTLITGDRVEVTFLADGRQRYHVVEANTPGSVSTMEIGGDLYVVPDAAQPYLATDALDLELFNVTKLIDYGYDDASSDTTPLIAQYDGRTRAAPTAPAGATIEQPLASIDGAALTADHDQAAALWSDITGANTRAARPGRLGNNLVKIWLDGQVTKTLDISVPLVGAPQAWAQGYRGEGATVAVLDTGYDPNHPDLVDAVTEAASFVPGQGPEDYDGHGTHVASTVAGSGAASGGLYTGVAPDADLLIGKVLGNSGVGQDSWVIAGMEWAAVNADVINMSLGDNEVTNQENPMAQALNRLSDQTGALFVVAAGNLGAPGTVHSPGTAQQALTVGATDDSDRLAYFSSQGPRGIDDGLKPDITAPGVGIIAARSSLSYGSGYYRSNQGTSMASPHVAGAAAILVGAHPDWSNTRLKNALMSRSVPLPDYNLYQAGMGRLDIPASLTGVSATGSVYFGKILWGDVPTGTATATITYDNATDADVALTLTPTGGEGANGPLVQLSQDAVVVPAGGSVQVEASIDRTAIPTTGAYLGQVVATDDTGAVVARTGTGIVRETEHYDLNISVAGRDGSPVATSIILYQYGTTNIKQLSTDSTTGLVPTQRLEPGIYSAHVWLDVAGENGRPGLALLHNPHIAIADGDVTVQLDASKANLVRLETPRESVLTDTRTEFWHDAGVGGNYTTFASGKVIEPNTDFYAQPTGPVAGASYAFGVQFQASAPFGQFRADSPKRSSFTPLYQRGSIRLDGTVNLAVVDGGNGTPDEIAAAQPAGKAVLVREDSSVSPFLRGSAAVNAGAALLVIMSNGPDQAVPFSFAGTTAVPVVGITKAEGDALLAGIAAGNARIKGNAIAYPDYGYDLYQLWSEVPVDTVVRPSEGELAALVDRVAAPVAATASVGRLSCPPYLNRCQGLSVTVAGQAERTDFVTAGAEWVSTFSMPAAGINRAGERASYQPGEQLLVDWTGGVTSAHSGPAIWLSYARGNRFAVNVPTESGPEPITGQIAGTSRVARLYQDDQLIRETKSQSVQTLVPVMDGVHTYRFEQETSRSADLWPLTTASSSVWTFQAEQSDEVILPLIHLDYGLAVDLFGAATKAGKSFDLTITPRHEVEAVGTGTITDVSLQVSEDDGATWRDVPLTGANGSWTATIDTAFSSATVSLRTTASDDAGNSVSQELISAVLLERVPANE